MKYPLLTAFITLSGLFGSKVSAQAPHLASASPFVVFTSVGAFDNLGTSVITGNIGTNVGAYTGFPPGTLIGTAHIANTTSAQVALDVNAAYAELIAANCTQVMNVTIGSNESFVPGTYCSGAATVLNGQLILDAMGNPNALFIIKINGDFAVGVGASVTLRNNASITNVYWQVNGQVTLSENSIFKGTIIANGAISMLEAASLNGRALSTSGAIALNNNSVIFMPTVLSTTAGNIVATRQSNAGVINWQTLEGSTIQKFIVERSPNGSSEWMQVGEVMPTGNVSTYAFNDLHPTQGINYYRLSTWYKTGNNQKSNIASIAAISNSTDLQVFPNPANEYIVCNGLLKGDAFIIRDISGRIIVSGYADNSMSKNIKLSSLNSGIYFLTVTHAAGKYSTLSFIKR
jgi:hypothetical protein